MSLSKVSLFDQIDWVGIPGGEVQVGTPVEELPALWQRLSDLPVEPSWFEKECPRHTVYVTAFAMSRLLVTVEQFRHFAITLGRPDLVVDGPPDHPVAVPYEVAEWLAHALSEDSGEPVALPEETQWERAARGDDTREYPWGERYYADRANIGEGSRGTTTPVGAYPRGAGPFGVLDLAGNLDEWTRTVYAPYPGAPPAVPAVETWALDRHITRGGGWNHHRDAARCARRHGLYGPGPVGVRLVHEPRSSTVDSPRSG
jgi:formylglycine-generating enzyme required for sulfatase activity